MKKMLIVLFVVMSYSVISQEYVEIIAKKTCECVEAETFNNKEDMMAYLGLCLMKEAKVFEEEFKRDYGYDVNDFNKYGQEIGKMIGASMGTICPKMFLEMDKKEEFKTMELSGILTSIEEEQFITFSIKDIRGRITKLFWLDYIQTDLDIISNRKSLIGKKLAVVYKNTELFDPKINDYRYMPVIKNLYVVE